MTERNLRDILDPDSFGEIASPRSHLTGPNLAPTARCNRLLNFIFDKLPEHVLFNAHFSCPESIKDSIFGEASPPPLTVPSRSRREVVKTKKQPVYVIEAPEGVDPTLLEGIKIHSFTEDNDGELVVNTKDRSKFIITN